MKFLVDNALSNVVSTALNKLGYDSVHVRDIGLQDANDEVIFKKAFRDNRIIISADTDFGWLLSKWEYNKPSVILFRKGVDRDPLKQIELLKNNLSGRVEEALKTGSIIIFETEKIRLRELPITRSNE